MTAHRWLRLGLGLLLTLSLLLHVVGGFPLRLIETLENFAYDLQLNLSLKSEPDPRIVIVDIDEKSLDEIGHWPWRRDKLATLVDTLFDHYKINVLGFDVVFAEPDDTTAIQTLDRIQHDLAKQFDGIQGHYFDSLAQELDTDAHFANSLKNRKVVLGYTFKLSAHKEGKAIGSLPPGVMYIDPEFQKLLTLPPAGSYTGNLASLTESASSAGFFSNELVDEDGVFRRTSLIQLYNGQLYEALSVAMVRQYLGIPEVGVITSTANDHYASLEWLKLGDLRIPLDDQGASLIPYRGPQGSFPYVSATDVIHHRVPQEVLESRIVLIGTTAPGLLDLRATPVQNIYPGVEAHANLIAGILDNTIKQSPTYTIGLELLEILAVAILMMVLLPRLSPAMAALAVIATLAGVIVLNYWAWQEWNFVLPSATLLVLIFGLFTIHMVVGYFVENRGKRQLSKLFGQYIPPSLVDEMNSNPDINLGLSGDSREMSVLFSDIRNFTTISEGLEPKELTQLMNEYLTPMTECIHEKRGTIDKYIGDAVMAFWGAPIPDSRHASHAIGAALDMICRIKDISENFTAKGWPAIRIGVGISSGEMRVGNMGSEFRMAYTVMGDTVNLGSRLEGLTKKYGVALIVSENTQKLASEYAYRELDKVRVKGKNESVTIYEPIALKDELSQDQNDWLKLHRQALRHYREQNWQQAQIDFFNLGKLHPDDIIYPMYQERIEHFMQSPPADDWDGSFTYTEK